MLESIYWDQHVLLPSVLSNCKIKGLSAVVNGVAADVHTLSQQTFESIKLRALHLGCVPPIVHFCASRYRFLATKSIS